MSAREDKALLAQAKKDRKKALNNKIGEVLVKTSFQDVEQLKEGNDVAKSLYFTLTVYDRKGNPHNLIIMGSGESDYAKTGKQETREHFLAELPRRLARRLDTQVKAGKLKLSRDQLKEPYATQIKGEKKKTAEKEEGGGDGDGNEEKDGSS